MARRDGGYSNYGNYDGYSQPQGNGDVYGNAGAYGGQNPSYQQDPYVPQDQYAQYGAGAGAYAAQQGGFYQQDPYAQQGGYQPQGGAYRQDPYYAQPQQGQGAPYGQYGQYNQYDQQAQYAQPQAAAGAYQRASARRERAAQQDAGYQTPYPVGSGRTYASSRPARGAAAGAAAAAGYQQSERASARADRANVASRRDYAAAGGAAAYGGAAAGVPTPKAETPISRRKFLSVAGGLGLAALVGLVGIGWYTHRAVACTINGSPREAPINSSAQELIDRGYIYPKAGNLISISAVGEQPQVLEAGAGNPYTLKVNGEPVDPASYRLREEDQLEFTNGTDIVEDVIVSNTEIPCGIQLPDESVTYYLSPVGYVAQWGRNGLATVETGAVSGISIDRGITQEPQDLIIARAGVNPADGRRLVALTFDDGPTTVYTPVYLDILARYGAKATFFNLGTSLEAGPDYTALAQRIVAEGHQLASHTYSHSGNYGLLSMDEATRNWEISHTFDLIEQATGVRSNVMRPPFGEFDAQCFLQYLASGGTIAYSAFWGVDSADWELPGVDQIVSNCCWGASAANDSYNGAIVLMHDGGGNRDQNVAALPIIIETFLNAGYQLVTMNEMLSSDPTFPEWVWNPDYVRPEGATVPPLNEWAGWRRYWS